MTDLVFMQTVGVMRQDYLKALEAYGGMLSPVIVSALQIAARVFEDGVLEELLPQEIADPSILNRMNYCGCPDCRKKVAETLRAALST